MIWWIFTFALSLHAQVADYAQNPHVFDMFEVKKISDGLRTNRHDAGVSCKDKIKTEEGAMTEDSEQPKEWEAARDGCLNDFLKNRPLKAVLDVYAEPSPKAQKLGQLVFSHTHLKTEYPAFYGIYKLVYIPSGGKPVELFSKERAAEHEGDILHMYSLAARNGAWFKLPPKPFPKSVWVNYTQVGNIPAVTPLTKAGVFRIKTKEYSGLAYLDKIENGTVTGRKIADSEIVPLKDPFCLEPDRPNKFTPLKVALKELYDENMHLKVEHVPLPHCVE